MPSRVTPEGIGRAGSLLSPRDPALGAALMRTVMQVESAGRGFDRNGRVLILYEPHIAYREAQKISPSLLPSLRMAGLAYPRWGMKPYPKDSYPSLMRAARINPEVAHRACSWGLPQILGANFAVCGYKSAVAMAADFSAGEDAQISAMARFIIANPAMHRALLARDWAGFARRYNGPGYAKNAYDKKLAAAYRKFKDAPFAGHKTASVGQTIQARADAAKNKAIAIGASGSAGGAAVTTIEVPPKPAPDAAPPGIGLGVVVGVALVVVAIGVAIGILRRNRLSERAPEIEVINRDPVQC